MTALHKLLNHSYMDGKKVIVYLHHHPYKNKLIKNKFRDAEAFRAEIDGKVFALLFGHNHKFQDLSDEVSEVPFAVDGGSMKEELDGHVVFRVIHLDGDEPTYTVKKSEAYGIPWEN